MANLITQNPKILLINPEPVAWSGRTVTLPLGLAYLAAIIEQQNCKVKCIDLTVESDKTISAEISDYDIIGISACTA